eukprot:CAMPEP_0185590632 /NCGR_PEP_ID=MMETSP0434-20130131/61450_1 /TAXON_ID=626734 ORGANISM="Favella taraikaensis, Strain Fe Narragansett Bay" /NCGR_SAMPLE_ID=MMETSP0434 /ASSEMBLY_ACC=CAM_ASM_000379 /LENGTH=78 /DNA_ID=CAMNT_0028214963 /DNA_START=268 /DNA_END=504 /DNA_ORIENTATION=+
MTETSTYKSSQYAETYLEVGKSVTATWPKEVFLLVLVKNRLSPGTSTGDFAISYQYGDLDPDEVVSRMSQAERDAYNN